MVIRGLKMRAVLVRSHLSTMQIYAGCNRIPTHGGDGCGHVEHVAGVHVHKATRRRNLHLLYWMSLLSHLGYHFQVHQMKLSIIVIAFLYWLEYQSVPREERGCRRLGSSVESGQGL